MISNFHSTLLGFVYIDKMSLSEKSDAQQMADINSMTGVRS